MTARRIRANLAALLAAISLTTGTGFASPFPPLAPDTAVEFYHGGFDHYFVTNNPAEIDALDSGRTVGWTRTGRGFSVYPSAPAGAGSSPVCRFYIPPQHGDSHFFSALLAECQAVFNRIGVDPNYSGYLYESPNVFYAALPDTATGACPAGSVPVFRLWNQRADSNHRYTTDPGIKAAMQAKGYLAEGYGPAAASMCSTAAVLVEAVTRASGASPFAPGCEGVPTTGFAYTGAEVEPSIAVNPTNPNNLVGAWQQDRWSNGGARGLGSAYSLDGGGTWTRTSVPFSRCSGGTAANGGDYERATDPWVTFAPDGTVYQIALAFNSQRNGDNAILVARSADGGRTWSIPVTLRRDGAANFNDKEAITADPTDVRYVYAVWDRLTGNNGPTWFARTVNGGATWEPARNLYDPDPNSQTINNQIVVLPDGTLVLFFTELANVGPPNMRLRIMRSTDKGATWSAPITIAGIQTVGTVDPDTGTGIRDGSILGSIAAGKDGTLAVAWQDSRFSGTHDDIAFSRSTDGGLTWTATACMSCGTPAPALLPAVAIRDDGVIGVAYYSLAANTADPATLPTLYMLATSSDGITWAQRQLADPFDYATAALAGGRYFIGDYMGMTTIGASFVPFFAQTTGNPNNRSDITAALARATAAAGAPLREGVLVKATTATLALTAEHALRVEANARRVLAERLPARPSP
jgi:hypothetical protein